MLAVVLRRFVLPRDAARKVCMTLRFPLPWNLIQRILLVVKVTGRSADIFSLLFVVCSAYKHTS